MNGLVKSLFVFERFTTARASRFPTTAVDWGMELRLWVATCVTGLSLFSARALGLALDETTSALAIIFFATLALYNLDGSLDAPQRTPADASAGDGRRYHLVLTGVASIVLLVLFARLSPRALLLTAGGALSCSLYAIPLTFGRPSSGAVSNSFRLKSLPFFKAPFVGTAVGIAVVWVPLWTSERHVSLLQSLALTSALAFYCTVNALLFDIPDVEDDRRAGVPTLPVRWGLARTRWASRTLIASSLMISAAFSVKAPAIAHSAGLFCLGAALLGFTELFHFRTPRRTVALWVDGALLLPLSVQVLLSH